MTLEKANEIKELVAYRNVLISDLEEFKKCDSITGHINRGSNGLGFKWEQNGRVIKSLIEGIEKEIQRIEDAISNI